MPNLAITTAIARLLIKHRLHLRSHRINFLRPRIRKPLRIKRIRQSPGRRRSMVRGSIAVRPGRRSSRLREPKVRTRPPAARESNSKTSPSHQNHGSKYKSRLLHLAPLSESACLPYRRRLAGAFDFILACLQIVSRLSGTGTPACALTSSQTKFAHPSPSDQVRTPTRQAPTTHLALSFSHKD